MGRDAGILAAAVRQDPTANPEALRQAAVRLRETLPVDSAASAQLARVLRLPLSLTGPWLEDTLAKLEAQDAGAVERLEVLAWAWGDVPADWPAELESAARRRWQVR
ncbi:MAG TPA: hypothetical protein VIK95_00920 [Egibacteraceae bacterium]